MIRIYAVAVLGFAVIACSSAPAPALQSMAKAESTVRQAPPGLPGMPPVTDPGDIYAADHAGELGPAVQNVPPRVYVPNSDSNTVDVIDPATYRIIDHFPVGHQPQHVVPSWDLKHLWILIDLGTSATEIDPMTGKK